MVIQDYWCSLYVPGGVIFIHKVIKKSFSFPLCPLLELKVYSVFIQNWKTDRRGNKWCDTSEVDPSVNKSQQWKMFSRDAGKPFYLHLSISQFFFSLLSCSLHHMALPNEHCTCTSFLFCSSKKKRTTDSFLCGAANSSSAVADLELLASAEWISVK